MIYKIDIGVKVIRNDYANIYNIHTLQRLQKRTLLLSLTRIYTRIHTRNTLHSFGSV